MVTWCAVKNVTEWNVSAVAVTGATTVVSAASNSLSQTSVTAAWTSAPFTPRRPSLWRRLCCRGRRRNHLCLAESNQIVQSVRQHDQRVEPGFDVRRCSPRSATHPDSQPDTRYRHLRQTHTRLVAVRRACGRSTSSGLSTKVAAALNRFLAHLPCVQ